MNAGDIVILLAVIAAAMGAALSIRRNRKTGKGCCGNCTACAEKCEKKKADA